MAEALADFDDLFNVGPDKPLGYLPVDTINDRGKSPEEIIEWANGAGLKSCHLTERECTIGWHGAIYVWDEAALQSILDANSGITAGAGWPSSAEDFVLAVANRHGGEPDLYELIGVAFADYRMQDPKFVTKPSASGLRMG